MPTNLTQIVDDYVSSPRRSVYSQYYQQAMEDMERYLRLSQRSLRYTNSPSDRYPPISEDAPGVTSTMNEEIRVGDYVERRNDTAGFFWLSKKPKGDGPYLVTGSVDDAFNSIMLEGSGDAKFTRRLFRRVGGRKTSRKLSGFGKFNKSLNEKGL